jgi:hypothetical protein
MDMLIDLIKQSFHYIHKFQNVMLCAESIYNTNPCNNNPYLPVDMRAYICVQVHMCTGSSNEPIII